ncbi:MAG: hypothetical protein ACUVRD_01890 [Bacteroidia bacterium]
MRRYAVSLAIVGLLLSSCKKKKDDTPQPTNNQNLVELSGTYTSEVVLDASKKYLLKGIVVFKDGGILRIPAGTLIYGDKVTKGTLIIAKGGKIFAEGEPDKPIVFTSKFGPGERDRGDWGGIVILGNAPANTPNLTVEGVPASDDTRFGGNTADESSGVLRYVRIEFAGVPLSPNNELNSLTLGGVGSGTTIQYVQASYGGDDGFEWFGGTVNAKYLVSYATWDDDFDGDFGYSGKVQFALAVRDPFGADQSGSNGFEYDNNPNGSLAEPLTSAVFSNITILGPVHRKGIRPSSNYQHGIHTRRASALNLFNSVMAGYSPYSVYIDGSNTLTNYTNGTAELKNNIIIAARGQTIYRTPETENIWQSSSNTTLISDSLIYAEAGYNQTNPMPFFEFIHSQANPNLQLPSGSPLATGANFTLSPKLDNFFERVNFRGALSPDKDWTDGWTNFNPVSAEY